MWKTRASAVFIVLALAAASVAGAGSDDAKAVIDDASKAMGVVGLNSITFSGAAAVGNFGQSRTISFGLASTSIRNYMRTIDFTQPASHATGDTQPPARSPRRPAAADGHVRTRSITPATPAWAAADGDLDDAVGISQGRGGEQRDGEVAEDRRRASTRS